MMDIARVMIWLRWRLLANLLRPTRKRDTMERASRAFQVIGPIVLCLILIPAMILMGALGVLAGWFLPQPGDFHHSVVIILRAFLVFETLLTLLAPLLRAAQGSTQNLTRFLLLPIPIRALYVTETLGAFADPWLAIFTSAALLLPVGLALSGEFASAGVVLLAGVAVLAWMAGLGTLSASLANLVFRDRRRGELATFLLMVSLALMGFVPGILSTFEPSRRRPPDTKQIAPRAERPPALWEKRHEAPGWSRGSLPAWALVFPPELYVRSVAQAADRGAAAGLLPLGPLLLAAAGVHWVGARAYRRLLETPERASPRRRGENSTVQWPRLPFLEAPASAVAVAQVRLVFRSVQGKIQFCMMPLVILVLGILWLRRPHELAPQGIPLPVGLLLAAFAIFLTLMTLEGTLLNQFAMDRAGLTLEFLSPISDRDLILGKATASAILAASRALPGMLIAAAVAPGGSLFLWLCLPAAAVALFAVMAPVGAILSALLPRSVDPGRIGRGNQPHPAASLVGMLCNLLATGPVAALALLAVLLLKSPPLALLLVSAWAGLALLISLPLLRLAERLLGRRRENLALVAQGR